MHWMLLVVLFAVFLPLSNAAQKSMFGQFQDENVRKGVDRSAIKTCWTLGGTKIEEVQSGNPSKGYQCTVQLIGRTENPQQAKEYCESRIPFYITEWKNGDRTGCTYQINLKCEGDDWQIRGKCYKVSDARYTWKEAENICGVAGKTNPKIAEYYDTGLNNYLSDILDIYDAWVFVPELNYYFANAEGNAAVYVQQGAYKFDARPGDLLMDDLTAKHQVICEYTPEMTMAELFYIGQVYSEIYPLTVYHSGAVIPSANMETIKVEKNTERFSTTNLKEKCMSVGKILNVDSYPITPTYDEFNDVKDFLEDQRFYLTNAFKNDGSDKTNYKHLDENGNAFPLDESTQDQTNVSKAHSYSISQYKRHPTMASMRAPVLCTLHTFSWKYGACPDGPKEWSEPPIRYERSTGQIVCHYVNNVIAASVHDAKKLCESDGGALTGFDSAHEFETVRKQLKDIMYANSARKTRERVDSHYWLGGEAPCKVDCDDGNGGKHLASWNKGVALNTTFLNTHSPGNYYWKPFSGDRFLSLRNDINNFHLHTYPGEYSHMLCICGKSAPLERGDRVEANVKG